MADSGYFLIGNTVFDFMAVLSGKCVDWYGRRKSVLLLSDCPKMSQRGKYESIQGTNAE